MGRRPFASAAVMLLSVSAFGGLSVGIPLVIAQLTDPVLEPNARDSIVPGIVLAYGLLSLTGVVAMLRGWRRATLLVVVPQGIVMIGLLAIWIGVVQDWSLLVVAGIAGAAAACAVADRRSWRG